MSRLVGLLTVAGWGWLVWAVDRQLRAQAAIRRAGRRRNLERAG